jgi:hypothetical protein
MRRAKVLISSLVYEMFAVVGRRALVSACFCVG